MTLTNLLADESIVILKDLLVGSSSGCVVDKEYGGTDSHNDKTAQNSKD